MPTLENEYSKREGREIHRRGLDKEKKGTREKEQKGHIAEKGNVKEKYMMIKRTEYKNKREVIEGKKYEREKLKN